MGTTWVGTRQHLVQWSKCFLVLILAGLLQSLYYIPDETGAGCDVTVRMVLVFGKALHKVEHVVDVREHQLDLI